MTGLMASIGSTPCLKTGIVRPKSNWENSDCWLTVGEYSGKSVDEIDKETMSFGEMQLKQEDRSYVHASIELHLHVVHVVPSEHESDQH
ncbi:hypothetical protein Tco_0592346 [Tanacetum coccineum]